MDVGFAVLTTVASSATIEAINGLFVAEIHSDSNTGRLYYDSVDHWCNVT